MSLSIRQNRFDAGELAPSLHARVDDARYHHGLRSCLNWLPNTNGALVNRLGTRFVARTRNDSPARLVPFIITNTLAFVLEFSDQYVRVYKELGGSNGQRGQLVAGSGFATLWTADMLPYLKFSQIGTVLTVCYGGQVNGTTVITSDIRYTATTDTWAYLVTTLVGRPELSAPAYTLATTKISSGWALGHHYAIFDRVIYADTCTEYIAINPSLGIDPTSAAGPLYWTPVIDASHPVTDFGWQMTTVYQLPTGEVLESSPSSVNATTVVAKPTALSTDRPIQLLVTARIRSGGTKLLYSRLYRGNNQVFGWVADIKTTDGVGVTYQDNGTSPDFTQQPPTGHVAFFPDATTYVYPAVIGNFEQRRWFANTPGYPQTLWGSAVGNFYDWDQTIPAKADNSVEFQIASERVEDIRSIVSLRTCLLMTGGGEWSMRGQNGGAVAYNSIDMKRMSKWGSSWLDPIVIGNGIIFNTAKGRVRDFFPMYGLYTDNWDGQDLSQQAVHLFDGHTIYAWAFQTVPTPTVWMVRDDGILISMTYDRTNKEPVVAFARHATGVVQTQAGVLNDTTPLSAVYESVCVIPSYPYEALYVVVRRVLADGSVIRTVERFADKFPVDGWLSAPPSGAYNSTVRELVDNYLDSAITYNGYNVSPMTVQLSGGTAYAGGEVVKVTVSGEWALKFMPQLPTHFDATTLINTASLVLDPLGTAPVMCAMTGVVGTYEAYVTLGTSLTPAQINKYVSLATSTDWAFATDQVALDHLGAFPVDSGNANGLRGVRALADGKDVLPTYDLSTRLWTLPTPAWAVSIGVSYNSDIELLPATHNQQEMRNRFKAVKRIGFEISGTREIWAGQDFGKLMEWTQRKVSPDSYGKVPLAEGYYEQFVSGDWNKEGRAVVRHVAPLPATLLSALREMEVGGT